MLECTAASTSRALHQRLREQHLRDASCGSSSATTATRSAAAARPDGFSTGTASALAMKSTARRRSSAEAPVASAIGSRSARARRRRTARDLHRLPPQPRHRPAADLAARDRPLDCATAFAYRLTVTKEPIGSPWGPLPMHGLVTNRTSDGGNLRLVTNPRSSRPALRPQGPPGIRGRQGRRAGVDERRDLRWPIWCRRAADDVESPSRRRGSGRCPTAGRHRSPGSGRPRRRPDARPARCLDREHERGVAPVPTRARQPGRRARRRTGRSPPAWARWTRTIRALRDQRCRG